MACPNGTVLVLHIYVATHINTLNARERGGEKKRAMDNTFLLIFILKGFLLTLIQAQGPGNHKI
jgi:hypothetical protein